MDQDTDRFRAPGREVPCSVTMRPSTRFHLRPTALVQHCYNAEILSNIFKTFLSFLQPVTSYAPSQLRVSRGAKHGGTCPHQMYVDLRQRRPLRLHKTTFSIACIRRHPDSVILRSGDLGFRLIHINEMLSRRERVN